MIEDANGAFHARFHFHERAKIMITVKMQSDFFDFGKKNVASEELEGLWLVRFPKPTQGFLMVPKYLRGDYLIYDENRLRRLSLNLRESVSLVFR